MRYFELRNDGLMIAKLSEKTGQNLIDSMKGHFRNYKTTSGVNTYAFVFHEDIVWDVNGSDNIKIFLWKDSILVHKND